MNSEWYTKSLIRFIQVNKTDNIIPTIGKKKWELEKKFHQSQIAKKRGKTEVKSHVNDHRAHAYFSVQSLETGRWGCVGEV